MSGDPWIGGTTINWPYDTSPPWAPLYGWHTFVMNPYTSPPAAPVLSDEDIERIAKRVVELLKADK